jgi:hypothetical protein
MELPDDDLLDAEDPKQARETGALAAGQDQAGNPVKIADLLDRSGRDAKALQVIEMFEYTPLKVQDADGISNGGW